VLHTPDYLVYAALGLVCAFMGIVVMRLVTAMELVVQAWTRIGVWRPVIGGFLLMPIAWLSPQALSAGHGALHLNLLLHPPIMFLLTVLALNRGVRDLAQLRFSRGLFFASLFLGSLVGQIFAGVGNMLFPGLAIDSNDAALVGMAAFSVSVVGGPMTLAMLMLETTHDFALMGVVLTASLISSAVTREAFGYSFSTWRLHVRGSIVRSPRDISWVVDLHAGRIMRKDWVSIADDSTIAAFRAAILWDRPARPCLSIAKGVIAGSFPRRWSIGPISPWMAWSVR
jgi:CIC family chloride channel protein